MIQIANQKVASIHYTLTNDEGNVLDSSEGQEPLAYLHGANNLVPGLEKELEGKTAGDKFKTSVAPDQAYGENDPQLIQELPRTMFAGIDEIEIGMEFHSDTENGPQVVEVVGIEGDTVTIDGNHPLSGMTLHFDVEVTEVRDATAEELEHGHVHAEGGCGHEH